MSLTTLIPNRQARASDVNDNFTYLENLINTTSSTLTNSINTRIPSGVILLWSGSQASIPTGWVLCNGSNGTPNLRDRFIVGAGSSYSVGATGGSNTHVLSIAEMPSHRHGTTITIQNDSAGSELFNDGSNPRGSQVFYSDYQGGGGAHENRPPYYALCYIMKT